VLVAVVVGTGALALAHLSARSAPARAGSSELAAASGPCSAVSGCVQGCALPVAGVPASPRSPSAASPRSRTAPAGPRSPTAPCSERTTTGCTEYVTSGPSILFRNLDKNLEKVVRQRSAPTRRGCGGPSIRYGERLVPPAGAERTLRRLDERFLQESRRAGRPAKR